MSSPIFTLAEIFRVVNVDRFKRASRPGPFMELSTVFLIGSIAVMVATSCN